MALAVALNRLSGTRLAAVAGVVFLYAWWVIDPSLQFEATPYFPPFMRGLDFALPYLTHPGGPTAYLSAWLSQYFRWAWFGALLITAFVVALCWATGRLFSLLGARFSAWLALAPATLVLVILNQFDYHLADLAATCLAVLAALGYAGLGWRSPAPRAVVFLGLAVLVYYLLGGGMLLFVCLCGLVEMRRGAGRLAGLLYLLAAEVVPQVIGVYGLDLSSDRAFLPNSPFDVYMSATGQPALMVLWGVLVVGTAWAGRRRAPADQAEARPGRLLPVLVALLLIAPVPLTFQASRRCLLQMNTANSRGQYDRTLALARGLSPRAASLPVLQATNYALYKRGALGEEMFSYNQCAEGLMLGMLCGPRLPSHEVRSLRRWQSTICGRCFLELGLVNQTEREAYEALTRRGVQASTLRLLADLNVAKDQPATARRFLLALRQSPPSTAWAEARLAALDRDPRLSDDLVLTAARQRRLTDDTGESDIELDKQCLALLRRNPANRMAYDYLMSYYLLNRDLKRFTSHLDGLAAAGYRSLPRHWQEAAVVAELTSGQALGLSGYSIAPDVYARFQQFSDLVAPLQQRGALGDAERAAAPLYGNTFFYYYVFGKAGVGPR